MADGAIKQDLRFLGIVNYTFRQMGVNLNTLKGSELLTNYWRCAFYIFINVYSEVSMIHFIFENLANIEDATRALSLSNQGFLVVIKFIIFLLKGDKCMKMIWDMNQLVLEANEKEKEQFVELNKQSQLICQAYNYACWVAISVAGMIPVTFMTYEYIRYHEYEELYPFEAIFPLHNENMIIKIFNYTCCAIYLYSLLNMTVAVDGLYGYYIFNISAHFRILNCKIETVALNLKNGESNSFSHDVGVIVRYHIRILEFVDLLNDVFGTSLWFEVLFSCLQMCFAIYNVNNEVDFLKMPFNFMVLVAISMQLMIYCFGGQKIKDESMMLSETIYVSFPWHKMSAADKKLMLVPLMRSQSLSCLRGLFFEADRNLLVYIVKTAFSFNALLNTMKEE